MAKIFWDQVAGACTRFASDPVSELFKYFSQVNSVDMGNLPSSIILVAPHPNQHLESKMVATVASRKISYLLFKAMNAANAPQVLRLYRDLMSNKRYQGPAGMIFESNAHVHLPSGYTLTLRSLDGKGKAHDLTLSARTKIMESFGPHPTRRYLVPLYSNNATFDSLYVGSDVESDTESVTETDVEDDAEDDVEADMETDVGTEVDGVYLFQMTVSETHDIQMSGCLKSGEATSEQHTLERRPETVEFRIRCPTRHSRRIQGAAHCDDAGATASYVAKVYPPVCCFAPTSWCLKCVMASALDLSFFTLYDSLPW